SLSLDVACKIQAIHRAFDKGIISYKDFCNEVNQVNSGITRDMLDDIFINRQKRLKNVALIKDIKLLANNYKIGILSNIGSSWISDDFLDSAEMSLFSDMVLSFEVGLAKPDPKIYQLACKRLDVRPKEVVYVDDSSTYCNQASITGMHAVLYKNYQQYRTEISLILSSADN
ncbi:HAD-IA family hydrolase, partial [Candidatus Saccharibacteria bacterium]|nr:HAD-IA family hydrolase [Candidatus Saccharibacteria bacterium]